MLNGIKKLFSCSKYDYGCNEIKNISFSPKGLISYFSNFMKFPKCKPVLPIKWKRHRSGSAFPDHSDPAVWQAEMPDQSQQPHRWHRREPGAISDRWSPW